MEPRNIFVKVKDKKVQLYLLDLEHMKPAGLFFKRRIKRNLRRFKGSLMFETNENLDDWNTFMSHYKNAFTKLGWVKNLMREAVDSFKEGWVG